MTSTRTYLPLTATDVRALRERGELGGGLRRAYAVTAGLRATFPGADEEELEFAALGDASDAARALRDPGQSHRLVAAADLDSDLLTAPADPGADVPSRREVRGPVSLRRIVSLHVDEAPTDDADLLWYDVTELEEVARILGA